MEKKICCLLLILLLPVLFLCGCNWSDTSAYAYRDAYYDNVKYVEILDDNNVWVKITDVKLYEVDARVGLAYIHKQSGEIIITHIKNVIIYC